MIFSEVFTYCKFGFKIYREKFPNRIYKIEENPKGHFEWLLYNKKDIPSVSRSPISLDDMMENDWNILEED